MYGAQNFNYASLVRHPGTCTFQRSQQACTFNLLCYVAGGVALEGCGSDISFTCCMFYKSPNQDLTSSYNSHHHKPRHHHHHHMPIDHSSSTHSAVLNSHLSLSLPSPYHTHFDMPHVNDYNNRNVRRTHPVSQALDKPRQSRFHIREDCKWLTSLILLIKLYDFNKNEVTASHFQYLYLLHYCKHLKASQKVTICFYYHQIVVRPLQNQSIELSVVRTHILENFLGR